MIWIEDLGKADLWSYREESWLVRRAFYESALDEIVKLHCLPEEACRAIEQNLPAAFDAALYRWEQSYFFKNCLGGYFGVDEKKLSELAALPALHEMAERLGNRPRVMVHRDFQSQNIIIRNAQAHLIDFQGMRPGLAEYDLASLLFDPYVTFSRSEREELLTAYEEKREAALLPVSPQFREIFRLCGIQRLMQALGFYGFAATVKGNKTFLGYIPAAMTSLRSLVGRDLTSCRRADAWRAWTSCGDLAAAEAAIPTAQTDWSAARRRSSSADRDRAAPSHCRRAEIVSS